MTCDFLGLANQGIQQLSPYRPGKPTDELRRELGIQDIIKLASNENPLGAGAFARQAAQQALDELHLYPDGSGFKLKTALAKKLLVLPEQITLGNGSNDLLDLLARAYLSAGDEAVYSQYGFAIYRLATLASSATPVEVPAKHFGHDLKAMAAAITERTKLVFVANPNNPTGTWFDRAEFEWFLASVPRQVIIVLDEAYFEYVEEADYPNGLDYLAEYPNLIVLRTFSKLYGLAALRVGYAVSHPHLADVLNRIRAPFNCNAIALAAAEAALNDEDHIQDTLSLNTTGLVHLAEGINHLGLSYIQSVANFVAIDCGRDGNEVFQALLREGVIVRPLAGYGLPDYVRVTVGLPAENERFLAALAKVMSA